MEYEKKLDLLEKLARRGVLHRDEVRGQEPLLRRLLKRGWVAKRPKRRRVYYELTKEALPLLEQYRKKLLNDLKLLTTLRPNVQLYRALLEDVRFVDASDAEAQQYLLLGDWQLHRPLVPAQLELAKHRYYSEQFS